LKRSLYGLRDAPKIFNQGLIQHLLHGGYKQSIYEQCLFYKWATPTSYIYIVFHVDDFNVSATNDKELADFEAHLSAKYDITVNENGIFLGIMRTDLQDGSSLFTKPFIIRKLFDKYLPEGPLLALIPNVPMTTEYIKNLGQESPPCDITKFLSLNGLLIQLIDVRPDIAFALSKISQRQKSPTQRDYETLMHVVHYLWAKPHWGIRLWPSKSEQSNILIKLRGYADAAYAIHCEANGSGKSQYTECFDLIEDGTEDEERRNELQSRGQNRF